MQAMTAGFEPIGYEVSKSRAEAGRRLLGARIVDDEETLRQLSGSIDIVYTSHVLEHVTSIRETMLLIHSLLRVGGLLFAFVPNCGGAAARLLGTRWGPFTNEAHVLSLDATFFNRILPAVGWTKVTFASSPYGAPTKGFEGQQPPTTLDGEELLVIAEKSEPLVKA
jgi:hypothetical protein